MSKTLFNQNTFNSKNVSNSNTLNTLKVDEVKATSATITNATITNLTNNELQTATLNIQANADNFANYQTLLTPGNQLDANFIDFQNNPIIQDISTEGGNVTINGDSSGDVPQLIVTDNAVGGRDAIIEIRGKRNGSTSDKHAEIRLTNNDRDTPTTHLLGVIAGEVTDAVSNIGDMVFYSSSNGVLQVEAMRIESNNDITVTSPVTMDGRLTMNARINSTADIITTTDFTGVGATFSGLAAGSIVTAIAGGELSVATTTALALDTAFAGYTSGALQTALDGKQDTIDASNKLLSRYVDFNSDTPILLYCDKSVPVPYQFAIRPTSTTGQTVSMFLEGATTADTSSRQAEIIFANSDTVAGTDFLGRIHTEVTNGTTNVGDLVLSSASGLTLTPQIKLQSDGTQKLLTPVTIEHNTTDAHLFIKPTSTSAQDGILKIEGARSGCSSCKNSQILFSNYDTDLGSANLMGCITGQQTDITNNYGKLSIYTSSDGSSLTETMRFNPDGQSYILGNAFFQGATTQSKRMVSYDANTDTAVDNKLSTVFTGASYSNFDENFKLAAPVYRNAFVGLLGDGGTTNGNILALALDGGATDNPNIVLGIDQDGVCEIAGDVTLDQDLTVIGDTYHIPQMAFYNFQTANMTSSLFGNGNYFVATSSTRSTGSSFSSHSIGNITFSENGYYKIRVAANPQTDAYNDRLAFMVYLDIGGTTYDENADYNFFGWSYTRNNSDGAHGNITFEDYIYIASSTQLKVRTKLDNNDRAFNDTLTTSQMECYCNLQIERIYKTNP